MVTDDVKAIHSRTGSMTSHSDGPYAFSCHIFAGDGIFAESRVGLRQELVERKWEEAACSILGGDSISQGGKCTEGARGAGNYILGIDIDTSPMGISLTKAKVGDARDYINDERFSATNLNIEVKEVKDNDA